MAFLEECERAAEEFRKCGACPNCHGAVDIRIVERDGDYGLEYRCTGEGHVMCSLRRWGIHNGIIGMHMVYHLVIPGNGNQGDGGEHV